MSEHYSMTVTRIRTTKKKNKIAVHQIYSYLDNMKADDKEQRENIRKIRNNLDKFNVEDAE